jgi:alanine racemase
MTTGHLTIDLDALSQNWRVLNRLCDGVENGAVVKADAYGLGLGPVAKALATAGARSFFVAYATEGAALRQVLGKGPQIHVMCGHMAGDTEVIGAAGLIPMLSAADQVERHLTALPGHAFGVQLDTGMNRLGMEATEWRGVAARVLKARPVLAMSHLACADDPSNPMNAAQLAEFRRMTDGLDLRRSLAATGGILLGPQYLFDVTRPGIGLYGGAPFAAAASVLRLSLPVVQARTVEPGETVGYAGAWTADSQRRIATVAAGYADGLFRALTGRLTLYAGDTPCPAVGRVSMDLITVDVTDLPEVPDALDVLCPAQGVEDLAAAAGTIGYEVLTSIGPRYRRSYAGGAT